MGGEKRWSGQQSGQTTAEYVGILVLAGITIVALATSDLGGTLAVRTETAVCTALGGADCGGGPGPVAQAPTAGEQVLAA